MISKKEIWYNETKRRKIMENKRAYPRTPIHIGLRIESLFRQDDERIENINEFIEVTDISKRGIGFLSQEELPVDYYFNARICLDEEKRFYCVIKIIRKEKQEQKYHYGCVFVGLAEMLAQMIADYQRAQEKKNGSAH